MTHLSRNVLTTMAIKSGQDSGNEDVDTKSWIITVSTSMFSILTLMSSVLMSAPTTQTILSPTPFPLALTTTKFNATTTALSIHLQLAVTLLCGYAVHQQDYSLRIRRLYCHLKDSRHGPKRSFYCATETLALGGLDLGGACHWVYKTYPLQICSYRCRCVIQPFEQSQGEVTPRRNPTLHDLADQLHLFQNCLLPSVQFSRYIAK
jgi:hypothetical protein